MASAAVVRTGWRERSAVLLTGTGAPALACPAARVDARTRGTHVPGMRQAVRLVQTPQQPDLQKSAYNHIAAANGGVTGPSPAWDPV